MGRFAGKVALVTGAARGQGRSHCVALAKEGASIAALDIAQDLPYPRYALSRPEDLQHTCEMVRETGQRALGIRANVFVAAEVKAAVEKVIAEFGQIDILLNNAGIGGVAPFWELTEEQWDAVLDVNLKGPWLVAKYVAPHMMARRYGKIVNTASVSGVRGWANLAHYSAAKHGLVGLTRTMAIELAPYRINVNCVLPGSVNSPMLAGMAEELGVTPEDIHNTFVPNHLFPVMIEAEDVTNAVLFLVSEEARYVTGHALAVDAGWSTK